MADTTSRERWQEWEERTGYKKGEATTKEAPKQATPRVSRAMRESSKLASQAHAAARALQSARMTDPGFHQQHLGAAHAHMKAAEALRKVGREGAAVAHEKDARQYAERATHGPSHVSEEAKKLLDKLPPKKNVAGETAHETRVRVAEQRLSPPGARAYREAHDAMWAKSGRLPDDPEKYFKPTPTSKIVDVRDLVTIRARPEGIAHAEELMAQAHAGVGERRKPISVRKLPNGSYEVVDGNSTTAVARKHGWKQIIAEEVGGEPVTPIAATARMSDEERRTERERGAAYALRVNPRSPHKVGNPLGPMPVRNWAERTAGGLPSVDPVLQRAQRAARARQRRSE